MPEISTLLQSLIAYLDQQTLESKHRMATNTGVSALTQPGSAAIKEIAAEATNTPAPAKKSKVVKAVIEPVKAEGAAPVVEPTLSDEGAKALAQYQADAAHAIALEEAKAKAKADAERLAAMEAERSATTKADLEYKNAVREAEVKAKADVERLATAKAEKLAELDYEKDVAPAIRNHAIDVNKRGAVMDALATYNVKNGKALAPKDYASFLKHLEEQVAASALGLDWYDYMDSLEAKA